ncbi:hypothetical protein BB560_007262 [Smittium megazygosporum]|uniref:SH3 domain-containing protein n=1 Tax=Smittium megazygosporum TaxID=133381 RepID=A0A2T9XXL3_9FUNG|nr:hypothetical protein BB560_007262 [Smittium megazygosporum]
MLHFIYSLRFQLFLDYLLLLILFPSVNSTSFSSPDQVIAVGDFHGISRSPPFTFQDSSSSKAVSIGRGTAVNLNLETQPNGIINDACILQYNGTTWNVVAGFFSKIGDVAVGNIYASTAQGNYTTFLSGLNGPVNSVYCDQVNSAVWFAGNFSSPNYVYSSELNTLNLWTGGLIGFNFTTNAYIKSSWKGLNGSGFALSPSIDNSTLWVGGNFNQTSDAREDVVSYAQPVNLAAMTIVGGNNFLFPEYANPTNAICLNANSTYSTPWLLRDLLPGYFRIDFAYKLTPSLLRLKNTQYSGRGTTSIRVERASDKSAIQLAYLDPNSNLKQYCTYQCPLANNTDWQEFELQLDEDISGLIINIVSWNGMGGGLDGVQLYQRDATVFGNPQLNFPPCADQSLSPKVSTVGQWTLLTLDGTTTSFIKSNANVNQINSGTYFPIVTAYPYLSSDGFYDVFLEVPSCNIANDCGLRTNIIVTVSPTRSQKFRFSVNQNVNVDTSVFVYSGYFPGFNSNFRPSVSLSFPNAVSSSNDTELTIIFQNLRFVRKRSFSDLNGVFSLSLNRSLSNLDGPSYGALEQPLPNGSFVTTISSSPNGTFFGGHIPARSNNLVYYTNNTLSYVPNGGLDDLVMSSAYYNGSLYVGGSFKGTFDKSISSPGFIKLSAPASGNSPMKFSKLPSVYGQLNTLSQYLPIPSSIIAGGYFSLSSKETDLSELNVALFDTSSDSWVYPPLLGGGISAAYSTVLGTILAGPFTSVANLQANGVVRMSDVDVLESVGEYGSSLTPSNQGILRVNSVIYQSISQSNSITVFGGNFSAPGGYKNVAYLNGDAITGISSDIQSEVLCLASAATLLFFGGVTNSNSKIFNGFSIYDMSSKKFQKKPQLLVSNNPNTTTQVNSIAVNPGTSTVFIGGNFDMAGDIDCSGVCTYDINLMRFSPLSSQSVNGVVNSLLVSNNKLLMGGQFVNGSVVSSMLIYNLATNMFQPFTGQGNLSKRQNSSPAEFPGPITQIMQFNSSLLFMLGQSNNTDSPFIYSYNNTAGLNRLPPLPSGSKVNNIALLPPSFVPDNTDGYVLSALGQLDFGSGQSASSAILVNGVWIPQVYTVKSDGSPGSLNGMTPMLAPVNVLVRSRMPLILVILIAFAISFFIVFLIVLAGILYIYYKNKRESSYLNSATNEIGVSSQTAPLLGSSASKSASAANEKQSDLESSEVKEKSHSSGALFSSNYPLKSTDSLKQDSKLQNYTSVSQAAVGAALVGGLNSSSRRKQSTIRTTSSQEDDAYNQLYPTKKYLESSNYPEHFLYNSAAGTSPQLTKSPISFFGQDTNSGTKTALYNSGDADLLQSRAPQVVDKGRNFTQPTSSLHQMPQPHNFVQPSSIDISQDLSSSKTASIPIRDALKIYPVYYAKFTFNSREEGELGFNAGDRVFVIDKSDEIWWMGIVDRGPDLPLEQGLFPATYIDLKPPSPSQYDI